MKNKTTKQGCAGNCAGKSSNNGFKTPKTIDLLRKHGGKTGEELKGAGN